MTKILFIERYFQVYSDTDVESIDEDMKSCPNLMLFVRTFRSVDFTLPVSDYMSIGSTDCTVLFNAPVKVKLYV